ncbi:glycosyltransferase [Streptomyces zhihengii]
MPFYPGPGVGGHCIPCDPHYLLWQLRSRQREAPLVDSAMSAIAARPSAVVRRAREALADRAVAVAGARILVVGVAYKPGVADVRESPALEIIDRLSALGARVGYHDPLVPEVTSRAGGRRHLAEAASLPWDLVLVHTLHDGTDVAASPAAARCSTPPTASPAVPPERSDEPTDGGDGGGRRRGTPPEPPAPPAATAPAASRAPSAAAAGRTATALHPAPAAQEPRGQEPRPRNPQPPRNPRKPRNPRPPVPPAPRRRRAADRCGGSPGGGSPGWTRRPGGGRARRRAALPHPAHRHPGESFLCDRRRPRPRRRLRDGGARRDRGDVLRRLHPLPGPGRRAGALPAAAARHLPPLPEQPRVSLLLAVRDEEARIEECVRSMAGSDLPGVEIVVVDDASRDGTGDILRRLAAELGITVVHLTENVGKKHALVRACARADGDVVVFTDSDCVLAPDAVRRCVTALVRNPHLGAVSGHCRALNTDASLLARIQDVWYEGQFRVAKAAESAFGSVTCVSGPLAAFRRDAVWNYLPAWAEDRFLGAPSASPPTGSSRATSSDRHGTGNG